VVTKVYNPVSSSWQINTPNFINVPRVYHSAPILHEVQQKIKQHSSSTPLYIHSTNEVTWTVIVSSTLPPSTKRPSWELAHIVRFCVFLSPWSRLQRRNDRGVIVSRLWGQVRPVSTLQSYLNCFLRSFCIKFMRKNV
jgi:hypothetical protein